MDKQPHPVDRIVGQVIKNKRIERGLSQGEVGDAIGVSHQQIQKYEIGKNRLVASKLYDISTFLNANISCFFQIENNFEEFETDTMKLLRNYNKLSDRDKRVVQSMVKRLLKISKDA
jgi:transcriptional regulator with XRE-family HTH domain